MSQTFLVASVSRSAPVGHTTVHWPQNTQLASPSGENIAGAITVSNPRPCAFSTPVFWISLQAATQRRQRMHLPISRVMDTEMSSGGEIVLAGKAGFLHAQRLAEAPAARSCRSACR